MSRSMLLLSASQMGQKLKTALRVPPGKLVSSFKAGVGVGGDASRVRFVRSFEGHRDGIWHVDCSRGATPVLASASAGKLRQSSGPVASV